MFRIERSIQIIVMVVLVSTQKCVFFQTICIFEVVSEVCMKIFWGVALCRLVE